MDIPNPHPSGPARLKSLLKAAGLTSWRLDPTHRALLYSGRSREWLVVVSLNADWFHAYTVFCAIPREAGLRARVFEEAMKANGSMPLAKFGTNHQLHLELEYRADHLTPDVVGNLTAFLHAVAEQYYPRIFRIVSGDATLDALAGNLEIPETAL